MTSDLAARIEAAEGPSRELDREIMERLKLKPDYAADWGARGHDRPAPYPYTASVDAALMLVPEGWFWMASTTPSGGYVRLQHPERGLLFAYAATPALALAAAALRAKENDRGQ